MSDRFILDDAGELIDLHTHTFVDYGEEVCGLLNRFSEEIKVLETQVSEDFNDSACITLQKSKIMELEQQNKELKSLISEVIGINGKLSERALGSIDKYNELYDIVKSEFDNIFKVVNSYSKQFKRHSKEFSFMLDLADDLRIDTSRLEALDD